MDDFKRPEPPRPIADIAPTSRPDGFIPRPSTPVGTSGENARPLPTVSPRPVDQMIARPVQHTPPPPPQEEVAHLVPHDEMQLSEAPRPKKRRFRFVVVWLIALALLLGISGGAVAWYFSQLKPAASEKNPQEVSLEVSAGDTWQAVAKTLVEKRAISSELAFVIYARLHGGGLPQASCLVSPADSVREIHAQIASGCKNSAYTAITFYPGATIEAPLYKPANSQIDASAMSIKNVLRKAGYSDGQVAAALNKQYSSELFDSKPAGTTLEGYVYGETYHTSKQASADRVLQVTFDQMLSDLKKYNLIEQFKQKHDLNLYQAITLASIVQRELNCEDKPTPERKDRCYQYQRTIAQVFLTRLKVGMSLGSDVTFIYAADQLGVQPTPDLESPYNTRIHTGLPPGPIASPGLLALRAVADPTPTEYLFFIAGDDGLIYFAKTDAEHQENIKNHCQQLCSEL